MLAVQIVNYKTKAYVERCVASAVADLEPVGLDYEINLLDNASGDDLTALGERYGRCQVHVAERNLGFGAGQNLLASKTDAEYLLILNPDVEFITPNTTAVAVATPPSTAGQRAGARRASATAAPKAAR